MIMKKRKPLLKANKVFLISFVSLIYIYLGTGCVPHLELGDHLIIQAMGVDYEEGLYKISAQYFTGQSGEGGGSKPTMYTAKGEGASIAHAMDEAGINAGRPLLMGECQIFIIGEGLKDRPLFNVLGTFTNEYKSYPKTMICTAAGKASDVLSVKYKDESVTMHRLHRMLTNAGDDGVCPLSFLNMVMMNSLNLSGSACLPLLKVSGDDNDSTEDGKTVQLAGAMLIRDNLHCAYIGLAETSGIHWLGGSASNAVVTVVFDENPVLVNLMNIKTTMTPEMTDGGLTVNVHCTAQVGYAETHIGSMVDEKNEQLKKTAEKTVTERLMQTLKTVVTDNGADVIGLEETIRHKDYRLWTKIEDEWLDIIKEIDFKVTADIDISRYSKN